MEKPRPDETFRDFIGRREPELVQQIHELRELLGPKEVELSDIRQTKAALRIETTSARETACLSLRAMLLSARDNPEAHKEMTVKELIVLSFAHHIAGEASPAEIGEHIRKTYARDVTDGTIRPTLARLKEEGVMVSGGSGKWELDPAAIEIMISPQSDEKTEGDDLLELAASLAWRDPTPEEAAASRRTAIEHHLKMASDADLIREVKSRALLERLAENVARLKAALEWAPSSEDAQTESGSDLVTERLTKLVKQLREINEAPVSSMDSSKKSEHAAPKITQTGKGLGRRSAVPTAPNGGN